MKNIKIFKTNKIEYQRKHSDLVLFIVSDYTIEACVMEPKPWDYSVDKSMRETNQNYLTADRQLVVNLLMPYFVI